jgi:hypothetical protein
VSVSDFRFTLGLGLGRNEYIEVIFVLHFYIIYIIKI